MFKFICVVIAVVVVASLVAAARDAPPPLHQLWPTFPGATLIAGSITPSNLDPQSKASLEHGLIPYKITLSNKHTVDVPIAGGGTKTFAYPDQMTLYPASTGKCTAKSTFSSSASSYATSYSESVNSKLSVNIFFVHFSASAGESVSRARSHSSHSTGLVGSSHCHVTTFSFRVKETQVLEPSEQLELAVGPLPEEYTSATADRWIQFFGPDGWGMGFPTTGLLSGTASASFSVTSQGASSHSSSSWSENAKIKLSRWFSISENGHGGSQHASSWFDEMSTNHSTWFGGSTAIVPSNPASYSAWFTSVFTAPLLAGDLDWEHLSVLIRKCKKGGARKAAASIWASQNITGLQFLTNIGAVSTLTCLAGWFNSTACSSLPAAISQNCQPYFLNTAATLSIVKTFLGSAKVIAETEFYTVVKTLQTYDTWQRSVLRTVANGEDQVC